ncbi:CoA transferase [Sedimentitalea sp. JM2-8]|uniref:CoA transferase n=1 Tax=Sedimentitalea xiamensis TaxID=3050037 RepID=A0ABT7FKB7_9RHOB|nr:CoA transferase [Sedimentitalea xiamensis]MDK3075589.1 CoA transferase [Sedimentitalea xiamensis]
MAGPLQGIRIIDAITMISGPLATMIPADQGAEVIKIENPCGGDHSRQVAGQARPDQGPSGGAARHRPFQGRAEPGPAPRRQQQRSVQPVGQVASTETGPVRPGVIDLFSGNAGGIIRSGS